MQLRQLKLFKKYQSVEMINVDLWKGVSRGKGNSICTELKSIGSNMSHFFLKLEAYGTPHQMSPN
jgi:hypothetical protein